MLRPAGGRSERPGHRRSAAPVVVNVSSGLASMTRITTPGTPAYAYLGVAYTATGCRHGGSLDRRPADARMLDPMAELIVDDEDLVVHLTLGEKIWSFHGNIRVRLSSIVSVAPDPKPWMGLRGWRMAGVSFVGRAVLGTRRHGDGLDFCILHRDRPAVQVDMASGRFSRLVIGVPEGGDAQAEAARIAAAAGIIPSAPAS